MEPGGNQIYEFASFRLDVKNCRLTSGGENVALTPKEFDLLVFLVENPGQVVKKDDLLNAVWNDAYVEEATLTRNISWLRRKLAVHDPQGAKIIETVPKRGYRFLPASKPASAGLMVVEEETVQHIQIEEIIDEEPDVKGAARRLSLSPAARVRFSPLWIIPVLLLAAVATLLCYREIISKNGPNVRLVTKIAPFAGLPGREDTPAFSPDGNQLAFSWDGGVDGGKMNIYVKLIGTGEPMRLTKNGTDDRNPVFSPDGKNIAFVRTFATHNEIIMVPALGGAEKVIEPEASYASVSFSPDGRFLATAVLDGSPEAAGIYLIDLKEGGKARLTSPETPFVDHTPRFSPDGKMLAFIRYFSSFRREIFVVPAAGGEPRQITSDEVRIYGLAWNVDGKNLFFTSFRKFDQLNLWQIAVESKAEAVMIPTSGKGLENIAISPNGRTIAYVEETQNENIWDITPGSASRPLIRSINADHSQQYSPDGSKIAFASDRTGNYEIWLADADGRNQTQLTFAQGSAGSPRFSPDGRSILFDAQISGGSNVYVISVNGGNARQLTTNRSDNSLPAWSVDGQSVYYLSNRSGDEQIWKMPFAGGEAVQLTHGGAFEMFAATDGKTIVYSKGSGKPGLWSIGIDGTEEKAISELDKAGGWRAWTVSAGGVYYIPYGSRSPFDILFFDFKRRLTQKIASVEKPPLLYYANLAVSPDGRKILYAQQDLVTANIVFAELGP